MALKQFYQKQLFFPGMPGLLLNPSYFARKGLADQVKHLGRFVQGKTLDIGCGTRPYEKCFKTSQYVGLEPHSAEKKALLHADICYDGYIMPFGNAAFDSILAFQVLEHVFEPVQFLHEIRRILKPEGTLLLTVPFLWCEHETPLDFARYSSFGLHFLLKKQGFEIIQTEKTMAGLRAVLQLLNTCLYNRFRKENRIWNLFISVLLTGPINILGTLFGHAVSNDPDLYLDNVILARPLSHRDPPARPEETLP